MREIGRPGCRWTGRPSVPRETRLRRSGARRRSADYPCSLPSRKGRSNLKRWDQLYDVRKFDHIDVSYGAPIILDPSDPDATALERVQKALDEFELDLR